jgi:hypothetical protein
MVRYINGKDRPTEVNTRQNTGDGSTTGFTVTQGMTANKVIVSVNGLVQESSNDFSISGTTLTFGTAPNSGDDVNIIELPV